MAKDKDQELIALQTALVRFQQADGALSLATPPESANVPRRKTVRQGLLTIR